MSKIIIVFLAISPVLLAGQVEKTAPTRYSVIGLGTLGGVLGSSAHSINNKGWIAGEANLSGDTEEHAALWRDGEVTDLGTLGGDNSSVDFPVKSNNGLIVGFAQTSTIDPLGENFCTWTCNEASGGACNGSNQSCRGFRWRNGLMEPLGTLGGNNSFAVGANNRGLVIGSAENSTQDPNCIPPQVLDYKPVVWHGGTIHELPVLAGDAVGAAIAVNDNNKVVGASGMCGSGPGIGPIPVHALLWQDDSVTDLGSLGGVVNNIAYAITNPGQIVGVSDLPGDSTGHAFLWQKGVMTDLGTLPGDFLSIAYGINNKGQVVGQSCDVNLNCRAFLWQSGVMIDLNTLTLPDSSLYLVGASDINSRGEIVGTGVDQSSGEPLAFLAVPCGQDGDVQRCSEAQSEVDIAKPSFVLPDYIRKGLRQRRGFRRLGFGLVPWPLMEAAQSRSGTEQR
jgi:probable HAF family extracellular repeat protein